jgi:predicted TIM-barrel fold metal-dependent hydrolase
VIFDSHVNLTPRSKKNPEVDRLLEAMGERGIGKSCIMPVCASTEEAEMVEINDCVRTEVLGYYDIEGFATVNPRSPAAQEELDRAVRELNLKGLSIDPSVQGFHFSDDEFWTLMEVVNTLEVPVFCKSGRSGYFNTDEINETVISFPKVPFIFSQMGLESPEKEFSKVFGEGNVYFETSHVPAEYIKAAVAEYGPERVIFGSGFSGSQYPGEEMEKIKAMGLSEEEMEMVLGSNFAGLVGVQVDTKADSIGGRLSDILKGFSFFR